MFHALHITPEPPADSSGKEWYGCPDAEALIVSLDDAFVRYVRVPGATTWLPDGFQPPGFPDEILYLKEYGYIPV